MTDYKLKSGLSYLCAATMFIAEASSAGGVVPVGTVVGEPLSAVLGVELSAVLGAALPIGLGGAAVITGLGLIIGVQLIKRRQK